jgi:hypothetical protein
MGRIVMAELHLKRSDSSLWRIHYQLWRDRYGVGSVYIDSLRDVVMLASQDNRLEAEQRQQLSVLLQQIDHDRHGRVNAGDCLERLQ